MIITIIIMVMCVWATRFEQMAVYFRQPHIIMGTHLALQRMQWMCKSFLTKKKKKKTAQTDDDDAWKVKFTRMYLAMHLCLFHPEKAFEHGGEEVLEANVIRQGCRLTQAFNILVSHITEFGHIACSNSDLHAKGEAIGFIIKVFLHSGW
jgi:hypothetical protein